MLKEKIREFPITNVEFLAWCRENPDVEVEPADNCNCLLAKALNSTVWWLPRWLERRWIVTGRVYAKYINRLDGGRVVCKARLPRWAYDVVELFDDLEQERRTIMTVREALIRMEMEV